MITIEHINHSLDRATNHDSGIDASVLGIKGFSTGVMRRMINNICSGVHGYLEVGAYFGGTACAAINNNHHLKAIIFEDGSQPFGAGENVIQSLKDNLKKHGVSTLRTEDFFKTDFDFGGKFDAYFYDGEHSKEAQAKALPYAFPALQDTFLFIVDDASWESVREGTMEGFMELDGKLELIEEWNLRGAKRDNDEVWWNGVDLYLCQKK